MRLYSSAFEDHAEIPAEYTCDGSDISPPLEWSGISPGTESLALIMDDPDAPDTANPKNVWVHWVVFNLPKMTTGLPAGIRDLPKQAKHGLNSWKRAAYGGPKPPQGRHRYAFKLYALDTLLDLDQPTKHDLEEAMHGHILGQASLIGTYERQKEA
jgi:Raf kinase inhibitor-like YbhB/YbcL family protein